MGVDEMAYLAVEDLTFTYPGRDEPALRHISFTLEKGSFTLLCGPTGCGKTTLLRRLRTEIAPAGKTEGRIVFDGEDVGGKESVTGIGFVGQYPEEGIVSDVVSRELAFGGENLGYPPEKLRRLVAETANWFGIGDWYHKKTDTLSGGQKQILSLAAATVTRPGLLVLDEPTARLDPIASGDFFRALEKLNRELGVTVLLTEHRLEEVLPLADRVIVLSEDGRIAADGAPGEVCRYLYRSPFAPALPAPAYITAALSGEKKESGIALTVRDARAFLASYCEGKTPARDPAPESEKAEREEVLHAKELWFRYEKNLPDVLRGAEVTLHKGEIISVLGGNGAGKSTLLRVLSGLSRPYRGSENVMGKKISSYGASLYRGTLALLPQDPHALFTAETVKEDMETLAKALGNGAEERIKGLTESLGVASLADRHPFDLSGGELQKCALAKLLLSDPAILLLDEPTKGIDALAKRSLGELLVSLREAGKSILLVTHDIEFAARYSDRCAFFFDGALFGEDGARAFFRENGTYTTAASRIARDLFPDAILPEEVVQKASRLEK